MTIKYTKETKTLVCMLNEEIDEKESEKIRRNIDEEIENFIPRKVILDFDNISFMDSSGIGMVIGRYKLVKMLGGELEIVNVHKNVKKIFAMSGLYRIIKISEASEENNNNGKENNSERII